MAQDHSFQVRNAYTGEIAVETESFKLAADTQYDRNVEQTHGADWKLWIVDVDGVSTLIQTQI